MQYQTSIKTIPFILIYSNNIRKEFDQLKFRDKNCLEYVHSIFTVPESQNSARVVLTTILKSLSILVLSSNGESDLQLSKGESTYISESVTN